MTGKLEIAITAMITEVILATDKYKPFNSAMEGYAVILKELDELWDEIRSAKTDNRDKEQMYIEAKQVAAMAIRFMVDCC